MRKFKCESDFMRESTRIYRAYVEKEKQLNDLIEETNSLKDLTNEAKERETKKIQHEISEKRAGMKTLLSNLENDFADWAFEFADLTGEGLDRKLATALSSGISYSPQELLYLAKKAGNNQADARLLHDYAKSHGYELKNYVSPDQKIEKFHKMNETFGKFADDEDGKNWLRLPDAEIDIFVGNQLSSVEIMPENMEIRTVAKSIDEEISRDTGRKLTVGDLYLDADARVAVANGEEVPLTMREFNILFGLLSEPEKAFSRQELMQKYWDEDSKTNQRAVDVYMTKLREKFSDCNDFRIATVHGIGYKAVITNG